MNKHVRLCALGLLLGVLVACTPGTPTPPADSPQLTEKNAWTGNIPSDAQTVSPDEFKASLASGDLALISSADLAAQKAARDAQFQQDKAFLAALPNKSPDVQSLLDAAGSLNAYDGDRPVKLPNGQSVVLFGLGTQLRNAVLAEQRAQSVDNALADYRQTYELLPDDLKAKTPSPDSLKGKSLSDVKAALETLNGLLEGQSSPVRVEPNGGALSSQAVNPGNGTDQDSPCKAPASYVKRYWFPLKNFVSPVKNQGQRGTCWDFAAIGAVESRERVQSNNPANLSEQFLANKVKQDWDPNDYADGYSSINALNTALSKNQQFPGEGGWTYNTASGRPSVKDGDSDSYANSCAGYTGDCSDTAHQSRRVCTTIIFKFCGYVKVNFGGPGVASGPATQIWKNGDTFDLNRYRLLLNQGHVLIASFPVYRGFDEAPNSGDAAGVVSNYDRTSMKDGKYVSDSRGGHVVQVVGFLSSEDLSMFGNTPKIGGGGYFIIKNSWGCGAGDGGYYYIPADYVSQIFSDLATLDFDARRSDAWTREQATPGGSQNPSIGVKSNPAKVDLRVETDLAKFFSVSHPVAGSVTLTVTSDKDGNMYSGPWSTDTNALFGPSLKYTFKTPGTRRLSLVARYGSGQASAALDVNAVNTPPQANFPGSGQANQGQPTQIAAQIIDPNEPDPGKLCATAKWSVSAPDTVSPTTGCLVTVTFNTREPQNKRLVQLTLTDSDGASTVSNDIVIVGPPLENPYPKITGSGVYARDTRQVPPGTVPVSKCVDNATASGTTIDLRDVGCNEFLFQPAPQRYSAQVTVDNPSGEALTYDWTLSRNNPDTTQTVLNSVRASTSAVFPLQAGGNSNPQTTSCRVDVKVNAPDPSRSKSQTVWVGNCTYFFSTLN